MSSLSLEGRIVVGKGHASGRAVDPEKGITATIAKQIPYFQKAGIPDIDKIFAGTINLDISPQRFRILKSDFNVTCAWWPGIVETFDLVNGVLYYPSGNSPAFLYYTILSLQK